MSLFVKVHQLFQGGEEVLVAVSGGPDSMALLHLLQRLAAGLDLGLAVAHFDHGLRGEDSRRDAFFVAEWARKLKLPYFEGRGEVAALAQREKISQEMAARRLRLEFLHRLQREHGFDRLALGHTADDQVELFFLRVLRGTGPEGLKGMWPKTKDGLVRPLLGVGKGVILAWLQAENLPYREDLSNLSRAFLRNRVRLDLLPALEKDYNPRLKAAIWRLMALLQEEELFLEQETAKAWRQVGRRLTPQLVSLAIEPLLSLPSSLRNRVIRCTLGSFSDSREITQGQVQGVLELAQGRRSGGIIRIGRCEVARAGPELHFFPALPALSQEPAPPLAGPGRTRSAAGWELGAELLPGLPKPLPPEAPGAVYLDAQKVSFPLGLRTPVPGDRFRPAGCPGVKKLQDFFVDARIPRWLRPYLPLVLSGDAIIWIPGLRLAAGVRATPHSREVLALRVTPGSETSRRLWEALLVLRQHVQS